LNCILLQNSFPGIIRTVYEQLRKVKFFYLTLSHRIPASVIAYKTGIEFYLKGLNLSVSRKLCICLFLCPGSALVHAQQADSLGERTEEIIITSSRIPQAERQLGTSVSVLTEQDLFRHGNNSLVDILRKTQSVAVSSSGGMGKVTAMRIRGEENFRTLTILDGIRLSDPSLPQIGPQIEHLLTNQIGRVEILRGPQGLGYGADAGGVVNISSRNAGQETLADLDIQLGEFDTRQYSGSLHGGNEKFEFGVSASDFSSEGFNSRVSDNVLQDDDGYDNTTLHGRLGFNLSDELSLNLVHRKVDGANEFDGCFSVMTVHDCSSEYELSASRAELSYESTDFTHELAYAVTSTERQSFAMGAFSFGSEGELKRLEYIGSARELPGFDLVFGADMEEARNSDIGRDNTGVHLEYLSDFSEQVFFTAGVRHDDNDDFGTNISYRLSAAYLLVMGDGSSLKFRAAHGTGFRAPSPYEIAYNSGLFSYPPASLVTLKQEESKGHEFGVEYQSIHGWQLEAVYFDQDVEDAIEFDLATFSGYLQDIGTSSSKGLELSGEFMISSAVNFSANYTYNDTERPNGLQRLRRPEQLANLGLSYFGMDDGLNINAFYRISRDSIDEVFGSVVALDNFAVLDISASYRVNDYFQLYGRVENALDEEYQEISDYNSAERAAYIGLKLNF